MDAVELLVTQHRQLEAAPVVVVEEHLSLKRLVADLLDLSPTDRRFEPKLHVLKEQLEHHHHEEEDHLFPKVRKLLSQDELDELGADMAAEERRLVEDDVREQAREQTAQSAPLR